MATLAERKLDVIAKCTELLQQARLANAEDDEETLHLILDSLEIAEVELHDLDRQEFILTMRRWK